MRVILLTLLLSGCAANDQLIAVGANLNDKALLSAEATICRSASIGSIMRRYNTPEKAKAWRELCLNNGENILND